MADIYANVLQGLKQFNFRDVIDILLVAILIYQLLKLTKKTRAVQVVKGLGVILIAAFVAELLKLSSISWVLNYLIQSGAIVIVILFQPELRRALEQIGRGAIFDKYAETEQQMYEGAVNELHTAILSMSKRQIGALMVFERKIGLRDIAETGTVINARISAALIENIFEPDTPLHDGATILRGPLIYAAGCFLPLSSNKEIGKELGTRHRAALGVSEVSDSVTIIVSEETGVISMAREGRLIRYLDSKALRDLLVSLFIKEPEGGGSLVGLLKRKAKNGKAN
ncbi:MAG: diadenylate cyclase CdaA [Christensenellales bacterium]